jgi:MerR family redox-sensitive transcriptional activator SoxR
MDVFSIGEVARRTGVRTSAVRFYEDAGILPAPVRVSGQRRYDLGAVRRIEVLRFAQQSGFTLDEIKTLFHGFASDTPLSARWQALARAKLRELDELARRIKRMRRALELGLQCGCLRIEDCTLSPVDAERVGRARTRSRGSASCCS